MIKTDEIKKILFISLSNLGDIILTTPVLTKLHRTFPEAKIDIITGSPGELVFKGCPAVNKIIVRKRRPGLGQRISQVFTLRKERYDLVVDLKNSLLPFIVGAKCRSSLVKPKTLLHKKDEHLSKISNIVPDAYDDTEFYLPGDSEAPGHIDEVLGRDGSKIVVINPGAKSHLKRWPAEKFAQLSDRLIEELGVKIVITGNNDDKEAVGKVVGTMNGEAIDLCSKTNLNVLAALMSKADIVITNDSAPLHVASAVNAPTIALFGPTDARKYGPLAEKRKVFSPKVKCRPCEEALCKTGPDEGCIPQVEVEDVFKAAAQMLGGSHGENYN